MPAGFFHVRGALYMTVFVIADTIGTVNEWHRKLN